MKSANILIILYQIIELFAKTTSDHVQMIHCIESSNCAKNIDRYLLEMINENLLKTSDACDNFWNYACGSWTPQPYNDHNDNFEVITNYYADQLINLLRKWNKSLGIDNPDINNLVDRVVKYYQSCQSISNNYLHMKRYLQELPEEEIFGMQFKWEFLLAQNSYVWQQFDWLRALTYLRKYGLTDVFLHESVSFAWQDSLRYVVQLRIPDSEINFQNNYQVLQLMQEFDLIQNSKEDFKFAQDVQELDLELVALYKKYENFTQIYFMTLKDLKSLVPSIDWLGYFEILLNSSIDLKTPIEFSGQLKYFEDLSSLLSQKNKRLLGFYILLRFCKYLWNIHAETSDRECLLHTNVMFPLGVNYLYNHFIYKKNRAKDEKILQNIFLTLKQEFRYNLLENKFALSNQDLNYLLEKLKLMELRIGNLPNETFDINLYYIEVNISINNFYYNHLEMLKFRTQKQHEVLLKPNANVNLQQYYVNDDISQLRNAPYFVHRRNLLIVPMLFLQLPFYHPSQHSVFKYSLLGWIIAHELTHAFDRHGLYIDGWGNENLRGYQISQKFVYLSSIQCLQNIAPTLALNERIADVNGLQLVWQAYSRQQLSYASELCDEDFSLQELFFLNFSQFFCGFLPPPIGHDRDDIRVQLAVANIEEFSKVFKCSKGSKENPDEKCKIWSI